MTIDTSLAPYMNRFNPDKEFSSVLFQSDKPLQQSELNEAQSIIHHYIGRIGDALFVDGNVQDGMDYIIDSTNPNEQTITVNEGYVYLNGKVRKFKQQTIAFNPVGEFDLQVKINQELITPTEDDSLLDSTLGVPSYLSEGAHRIKETVALTSNDVEGSNIYRFRDGNLFIQSQKPEISKINDILAERTYDESGSYKVDGLDLYLEKHPTNSNNVNLVVDTGRAYVLGYQITKPTTTKIAISKALGTRTINSEVFYYSSVTKRGSLGSAPVKTVDRVTAQVKVVKQTVNHGTLPNASDLLANSSVFDVEKVWQESGGVTTKEYVRGTDYQLINGNAIDWSPAGSEPSSGTTYFVTYSYNKTLVKDTDYKVVNEGSGDNITTYVDFNGMQGVIPINNSMVTVDYTFYLSREDLVIMDKDGEITVKQGEYTSFNETKPPHHVDPYTLILGSVKLLPNSNNGKVVNSSIKRLSMADLQKMKSRIDNMEYNQAVFALDQPSMAGVNPTTLRGVFSDGFISTSKADTTHPDMNVAYSFDDAEITLPYSAVNVSKPTLKTGSSNAHVWGRLVTAPFTQSVGLAQLQSTETINVNPYDVYNKRATLKITPSEDSWIEEDNITVYRDDNSPEPNTIRMRRWWAHRGDDDLLRQDRNLASFIQLDEGQDWDMRDQGMWWRDDEAIGRTGTILKDGGRSTLESSIEYMRSIPVTFECKNLLPNTTNLQLLFDGVKCPITPATGFVSGSEQGTINANASGIARGSFVIPEGIRTGIRQVFLQNGSNSGSTTFIAQGTKRTVEDIILRSHVTIDLFDPLAQSFQFPTNQVVSSLDLYFASKDNAKNVTVQVRNVTEGGMPGKTIFAENTLEPTQINVSANGSAKTVVTFDDPLVCDAGREYCIVILTDTDQYTMHIATRGQTDKISGQTVTKNPYNVGVLYSSSNASAWTIHQDSDLKFAINVAKFNSSATLLFNPLTDMTADAVMLLATYLTPENTGARFEARMVLQSEPEGTLLSSKPWLPIENYIDVELGTVARQMEIQAHFVANDNMSPLLSLQDITLTTFLSSLQGSYVSRTVDMTDAPFNKIRVQLEIFEPGGTQVVPRYSLDGGTTWKTFTVTPTTSAIGDGFIDITFEEAIGDGNTLYDSIKYRVDMTSTNSFTRPRCRKLRSNVTEQ